MIFNHSREHGQPTPPPKNGRAFVSSSLRVEFLLTVLVGLVSATTPPAQQFGQPWKMHIIDDGSHGADGTRLADANGDGLLDIVTGWEEGAKIRVCLNPGLAKVREKWPVVTVGEVGSPEDAVFADLDGDGAMDVVSSCEGSVKTVFVHWGPKDKSRCADPNAWKTEPLPASIRAMQWMFCVPMQIDGQRGIDVVCGAKGKNAQIGWFQSPQEPRRLDQWKWHPLRPAGWIMSLVASDMDGDGDLDILFSDRYGDGRGVYWLENPGRFGDPTRPWKQHTVGATDREAMFLFEADMDGDGLQDIVVGAKPKDLVWLRRLDRSGDRWETHIVKMPEETGRAKGIAAADINGDGRTDLIFTCEGAENRPGVMWMEYRGKPSDENWIAHDISGIPGIKYDLAVPIDIDGDGDLDVLTSEERQLNAVVWYENPTK